MGVSAAIVVAAAVSAGSAVYSNNETKRSARLASDTQTNAQNKLLDDQAAKDQQDQAAQDAAQARARQKTLANQAQGAQGTILTSPTGNSPVGVAGTPGQSTDKTLIGY